MLRQWARLLHALQRQLHVPVRFVSVIRIVISSVPTPRGLHALTIVVPVEMCQQLTSVRRITVQYRMSPRMFTPECMSA